VLLVLLPVSPDNDTRLPLGISVHETCLKIHEFAVCCSVLQRVLQCVAVKY